MVSEELAALGPFFAVSMHQDAPPAPWRSIAELIDGSGALADRVAQVRAALTPPRGDVEYRVATSVAHLGLAARLVAPVLGLVVLDGRGPDGVPVRGFASDVSDADSDGADRGVLPIRSASMSWQDVYWQPELGGPFPLSLPHHDRAAVHSTLAEFIDGPLTALVDATLTLGPLAPAVLWGNTASAIASAGRLIATAQPDLGDRSASTVADLLAHPRLRDAHEVVKGRFLRRNCCLIYRIAGPGPADPGALCGDCVLAR